MVASETGCDSQSSLESVIDRIGSHSARIEEHQMSICGFTNRLVGPVQPEVVGAKAAGLVDKIPPPISSTMPRLMEALDAQSRRIDSLYGEIERLLSHNIV